MFDATCAANASCISIRSMSASVEPGALERLGDRERRAHQELPAGIHGGHRPRPDEGQRRVRPRRAPAPRTSAAPRPRRRSAATSCPRSRCRTCGRTREAARPAPPSVVSRRSRLSASTRASYAGGTSTAAHLRREPPVVDRRGRARWLGSAIRSCSSRVMPFSLAIFSADWPMVRPVDGSAMAGVSGTRSRGRTRGEGLQPAAEAASPARPPPAPAPCRGCAGSARRRGSPPRPRSRPRRARHRIAAATSAMASFAEAQARLTVWPGVEAGARCPGRPRAPGSAPSRTG